MWRLEPGVGWLIVVLFVFYAASRVPSVGKFLFERLALWPRAALLKLEVWQFLSALFVQVRLGQVVFDAIFLYLMGSFLERTIGRARFYRYFLVTGIAGNLFGAVVALLLKQDRMFVGIEPSIFALMLSSGFIFGRQQVQLFGAVAARADIISWVFGGFWLLRHLLDGDFAMLALDIGAGLTGWLMLRRNRFGGGAGNLPNIRNIMTKRRARSRFEVLEGGKPPEKKWLN